MHILTYEDRIFPPEQFKTRDQENWKRYTKERDFCSNFYLDSLCHALYHLIWVTSLRKSVFFCVGDFVCDVFGYLSTSSSFIVVVVFNWHKTLFFFVCENSAKSASIWTTDLSLKNQQTWWGLEFDLELQIWYKLNWIKLIWLWLWFTIK